MGIRTMGCDQHMQLASCWELAKDTASRLDWNSGSHSRELLVFSTSIAIVKKARQVLRVGIVVYKVHPAFFFFSERKREHMYMHVQAEGGVGGVVERVSSKLHAQRRPRLDLRPLRS